MSDSVAKNLIEKTVAKSLNSTHEPYYILCKSHTMEKLDKSNLSVLNELEQSMKIRNTLESVNPALKPIFRGKAAVVEAGIYALLIIVAYDKSANSRSLADEFDCIVEREGKVKHISLYHHCRFAKLGYAAASILAALTLLQMLLETEKNNLSKHAGCRSNVNFLTELHVLAYFTGFNLTSHDSYFTILVEVFTNHILAENTNFTNHLG